jgi:RNA polymerase sigma-70 factor (ECF subfamily)
LIEPLTDTESPPAATSVPEADLSLLLRQAQAGERDAFEALYGQLKGRVFGLALRLAGGVPEAEELVQEVFVRAWQHRGKIENGLHLRAWLKRVTVNLWITRLRDRRRWADPGENDSRLEGALVDGGVQGVAPGGLRVDLERAVAELPVRLRTILVLFDLYGFTHAEIAGQLGIRVGSSKIFLHRARRRLREVLS